MRVGVRFEFEFEFGVGVGVRSWCSITGEWIEITGEIRVCVRIRIRISISISIRC